MQFPASVNKILTIQKWDRRESQPTQSRKWTWTYNSGVILRVENCYCMTNRFNYLCPCVTTSIIMGDTSDSTQSKHDYVQFVCKKKRFLRTNLEPLPWTQILFSICSTPYHRHPNIKYGRNDCQKGARNFTNQITIKPSRNLEAKSDIVPTLDSEKSELSSKNWLHKIDQLALIHGWSDATKSYYIQAKLSGLVPLST